MGFIIAPIFRFENWQEEYTRLFISLKQHLTEQKAIACTNKTLTFEFITHRFTARAKSNILDIFPKSQLPMNEENRKFKYGQFGYGKYLYKPEEITDLKDFFTFLVNEHFPQAETKYFV